MFLEELTINLYNIVLHKTVDPSFPLNITHELLNFLPLHSPKQEERRLLRIEDFCYIATKKKATIKYAVSHAM